MYIGMTPAFAEDKKKYFVRALGRITVWECVNCGYLHYGKVKRVCPVCAASRQNLRLHVVDC